MVDGAGTSSNGESATVIFCISSYRSNGRETGKVKHQFAVRIYNYADNKIIDVLIRTFDNEEWRVIITTTHNRLATYNNMSIVIVRFVFKCYGETTIQTL